MACDSLFNSWTLVLAVHMFYDALYIEIVAAVQRIEKNTLTVKQTDRIVHYQDANHIAVMHKGRYFEVLIYYKGRISRKFNCKCIQWNLSKRLWCRNIYLFFVFVYNQFYGNQKPARQMYLVSQLNSINKVFAWIFDSIVCFCWTPRYCINFFLAVNWHGMQMYWAWRCDIEHGDELKV